MAAQPASVGTDTSEAPAEPAYMLVDVTAERAVCEWWFVDTVAAPSSVQTFGAAFEVRHGSSRLAPSAQTTARTDPPTLAP